MSNSDHSETPQSPPVNAWRLPGELRADCSRCAALCCVLAGFYRSADFAIDKPPGVACPNLGAGFRCSMHDQLEQRGFGGCVAYECYGAGQRAVELLDGELAADWWRETETAEALDRFLRVLRPLHEMRAMLLAAEQVDVGSALVAEVRALGSELAEVSRRDGRALLEVDLEEWGRRADELLSRVSSEARRRWTEKA